MEHNCKPWENRPLCFPAHACWPPFWGSAACYPLPWLLWAACSVPVYQRQPKSEPGSCHPPQSEQHPAYFGSVRKQSHQDFPPYRSGCGEGSQHYCDGEPYRRDGEPYRWKEQLEVCLPANSCVNQVRVAVDSLDWISRQCLELKLSVCVAYRDSCCRIRKLERCFRREIPWCSSGLPELSIIGEPCYRQYGERLKIELCLGQHR